MVSKSNKIVIESRWSAGKKLTLDLQHLYSAEVMELRLENLTQWKSS